MTGGSRPQRSRHLDASVLWVSSPAGPATACRHRAVLGDCVIASFWLASLQSAPEPPQVAGGEEVAICGWPTVVRVGGCSGTLIHPEVVLYGAHLGSGTRLQGRSARHRDRRRGVADLRDGTAVGSAEHLRPPVRGPRRLAGTDRRHHQSRRPDAVRPRARSHRVGRDGVHGRRRRRLGDRSDIPAHRRGRSRRERGRLSAVRGHRPLDARGRVRARWWPWTGLATKVCRNR